MVEVLLLVGADVEAGRDGVSPLQAAARAGDLKIMQVLVENEADVNARGGFHGNPLAAAMEERHRKVNGADDESGLYTAAQEGDLKMVTLLTKCGMSLNDGFYGNALELAVEGGHEEVVEFLLEFQAAGPEERKWKDVDSEIWREGEEEE